MSSGVSMGAPCQHDRDKSNNAYKCNSYRAYSLLTSIYQNLVKKNKPSDKSDWVENKEFVRSRQIRDNFYFGFEDDEGLTFKEALVSLQRPPSDTKTINYYGYKIMLFEIWSKIGKWVGDVGRKEPILPWKPKSPFFQLSAQLDAFIDSLPAFLRCTPTNLEAHLAKETTGSFGYLHTLYFVEYSLTENISS